MMITTQFAVFSIADQNILKNFGTYEKQGVKKVFERFEKSV